MIVELCMSEIIKLREARKQADRLNKEERAAANRLRYGRSKAERNLHAARDTKQRHTLDQHRIETGDER